MKNLKKRIENSYNANGTMPNTRDFNDALKVVKGNKVYYFHAIGSGRWTKITESNPEHYLTKWGIDYEKGNDAPRGGKLGNYIQLSKKGRKQTALYRKELKVALEIEQENKKIEQLKREENRLNFIEEIKNNILDNKEWFIDNKKARNSAKELGNKDEWQALANTACQKASNNNFSLLNWSEIFSIINNKL